MNLLWNAGARWGSGVAISYIVALWWSHGGLGSKEIQPVSDIFELDKWVVNGGS